MGCSSNKLSKKEKFPIILKTQLTINKSKPAIKANKPNEFIRHTVTIKKVKIDRKLLRNNSFGASDIINTLFACNSNSQDIENTKSTQNLDKNNFSATENNRVSHTEEIHEINIFESPDAVDSQSPDLLNKMSTSDRPKSKPED